MLRRNARLRKEFLYRKSLEGKEKEIYEKKRKLKKSLEEGNSIPSELRDEENELRKKLKLDDEKHEVPTIDDEYQLAGVLDPKICVTTSRDPTQRLIQFAKEIALIIPNASKMNRGKHVIDELVSACRANEMTDLIIVHETRGEPDGMIISHLPYGPTSYFAIKNCVLRHDIVERETISEQYPHLIFHNFTTPLGERVTKILKHIFPVPKEESERVISFINQNDFLSFRHHMFKKKGREIDLKEIGPRFEMKLYQIKLGTVEMQDAEKEWVLRPYLHTAHKKDYL